MSVEALTCPRCGAPIKPSDAARCEYCGANLTSPKQILEKTGAYRGIARNVQQREEGGFTVLSFRVERVDREGNILDYVQVELRDPKIRGTVVDGDEVEVQGEIDEYGILIPERIQNLRTQARVSKSSSGKGLIIFLLPFLLGGGGLLTGSMEGAMTGFLAGCFLAVVIFIIMAVARK
jgi:hypothetical protein